MNECISKSNIGKAQKHEKKVLQAQEVSDLQKRIPGLSNESRKNVTTWVNEKFGRGSIEPGFTKKLVENDKLYKDYFEIKEFEFETKDGSLEVLPAFVCTDLLALTKRVLQDRGYEIDHTLCKFQIDKGQGYLKFVYSVVDLSESKKSKETYLDTGVNKLFILAILHPKIEESHHNFKIIMSHMNVWDSQEYIWDNGGDWLHGGDYKALNILAGKTNHASKYPCHACKVRKDNLKEKNVELLSVGDLHDMHQAFVTASASNSERWAKDNLKNVEYQNCKYEQLFVKNIDKYRTKKVIDVTSPGTLHIFLGCFKKQYKVVMSEL